MSTGSNSLQENFKAPFFKLKNVDGKFYSIENLVGEKGTLIMFICNHCPYVKAVIDKIIRDANELSKLGVNSIAIMSNDTKSFPEDSYANMKLFYKEHNFSFPYLLDDTQKVAKEFGAVCTPDFFGLNKDRILKYRGRLDNSKTNNSNINRELFLSMKAIIDNKKIPFNNPSIGCSIKWKN